MSLFSSMENPILNEVLARVDVFMRKQKAPCFLVGGLIRDRLLNRMPPYWDVDLAVERNAILLSRKLAESLQAAFVPLDEENGCARVVVSQNNTRIVLDLADFRASSLEGDLGKRDFTINAMAMPLSDWVNGDFQSDRLIDPLRGRQALRQQQLSACFNETFKEDPIRILRAGRFAAQLDFVLDESLPALMAKEAAKLAGVSAERVRDELMIIFETNKAHDVIRLLDEIKALDAVFPELAAGRGLDQGDFHHLDVLSHQLEAVAQADRFLKDFAEFSKPLQPVLNDYCAESLVERRLRKSLIKLAALIHDVGKPSSRQVHPNGEIWFIGHEHTGLALAEQIVQRLRFSNRECDMVCKLVLHHLRPGFLSRETQLTRRAVYRFFKDLGDDGPACLLEWWADRLATRGAKSRVDQIDEHRRFLEEMLGCYFFKAEEVVAPPRLIDGNQLMAAFALKPGPRVGQLLDAIEEAQAEGRLKNAEEALALAGRLLQQAGQ